MTARILRIDDATLAGLAAAVGGTVSARRALGAELDATADALILGDGDGPDRTAAASFLLAITQRVVVIPVIGADQHPINLGRVTATLTNLHRRRVGIAGSDPGVLALISRLWESWPQDSLVVDVEAGVYVDDTRIRRISDPVHPIGGPLTVPVDVTDKPVTILLDAAASPSEGVDLVLDAARLPRWKRGVAPREDAAPARSARAVLGVGPSVPFAQGSPAFDGSGRLDQV